MGLVIPHIPSRLYPMGASRPRPYDAEVEYLESTGTQYIDTGYAPNLATDTISIKFMPFTGGTTYETYFGVVENISGTGEFCELIKNNNNNNVRILRGSGNSATALQANDAWCNFTLTPNSYIVDGSATNFTYSNVVFSRAIYLFCRNNTNLLPALQALCRIASFSVTRNGVCILDMISVRVGTTGYMYDRVSGRLFGNAGSGEFKIGPEKGVVNPYQTDDNALWMMYNGAWNNGVGRFSPTATQIVDCMNNEAPLAAGSVGDDRMWREPTLEYSITPSARLGQMIYDRNFSVMFIGRIAKRTFGAQDVMTFYDGTTRRVGVICTNSDVVRGFLYRNAFNSGDIAPDWNESNEVVFAWLFSFGNSTRILRYRQTDGAATKDYTLSSDAQLYDQFTPTSLKFGYSTKCEIAVAAVYNRAITQMEFEAFWLAAKTQYNLPTT